MLRKAYLTKQITLTVANEVGVLDRVTRYLSERGINIEAVAGYELGNAQKSHIMLIVDDTRRATDTLREKDIGPIDENDVIVVELDNKPGALKSITTLLAQKVINIRYIYATTSPEAAPVRVVVSTSDNEKAAVAVKKAAVK